MKAWKNWISLLRLTTGLVAWTCSGCLAGSSDAGNIDAGPDADATVQPDGDQTNSDGELADDGLADADPGPVEVRVSAVLPSRGPVEGGIWANIVGSGFVRGIDDSPFGARDVTDVTFGDNSAIDIEVIRDDMISVRTPVGMPGPADVSVENPNGRFTLEDAFNYFETVTAFRVEPVEFSGRGGTAFMVEGTGFTPDTVALVGGRPASSVVVTGNTQLQAVSPPAPPGPADLEVVNRNGRARLFRAITYHPVPRLQAVDPPTGPEAGGTPVLTTGDGFEEGVDLLFGTTPATGLSLLASDRIEAISPAGTGSVDITLVGPVDSSTLPGGFIYLPETTGSLTVTGVAPAVGPAPGGGMATVAGEGFLGGVDNVLFGSNSATGIQQLDDRKLEVVVPAGEAGSVSVTVRRAAEQASLPDAYRYIVPLQALGIDPPSGPVEGGTQFSIQGVDPSGFHPGVEVRFGGVPAQSLSLVSANELSGLTPPGTPGPVDVLLRDLDSEARLASGFTYTSGLSLLRVDPDSGSMAGGTYVVCYGQGLGENTKIFFKDAPGNVIQVLSSSVLIARTPRGDPGEVPVAVERAQQRAELPAGFSYFDPTNDRGGASGGPIQGSLNVTALDGGWTNYGAPVPEATVTLEEPAISGITNDHGQVTFSGPAMVRAVTITVAKEGFEAITLVNLNATNLTVYLYPNQRETIEPQPIEIKTSDISGRVFGFKDIPGLPAGPTVSMQARVNLTYWSIYSVPPYGGVPVGQIIEQDGDPYQFEFLRLGSYSVYALFGAFDSETETFTPALLGLRRAIKLVSEEPATGQDVVLATYLDQSVSIHLQDPPLGIGDQEVQYGAYVSLDLGRDGIIYLAQDSGRGTELLLEGLPAAASEGFIFVGLASLNGTYPLSYTFRRQEGDLSEGVTLGPFLGFTQITEPEMNGKLTNGRIAWEISGPQPELIQILIETNEFFPNVLWRIILPGDVTEATLPAELLGLLPQGEPLILLVYTANSPRFNFDRFNYSQLSTGRWTGYTVNYTLLTAP